MLVLERVFSSTRLTITAQYRLGLGCPFAMGLLGTGITGWLAYVRLTGQESIANRPLLLFGILLVFTGVQLVTLGLLAELQARTYHESQNKPTYAIREILESQAAEPMRASR